MFKFLIISFLVMYLLFKLGGFFIRALFYLIGARITKKHAATFAREYQQAQKREGEISIEYVPSNNGKSKPQVSKSKDEEYVDYEEVK